MWLYGSGFPKSLNIWLAIDKKNWVESEIVWEWKSWVSSRAYQSEETTTAWWYEIKKASNEWNWWGTALKPSYEPIIVARKPLEWSCTDNVIKYGVGGINIDECRIWTETISTHNAPAGTFAWWEYDRGSDTDSYSDHIGRFPANTILTYNETSDERLRYFYCAKASKRDRDEGLDREWEKVNDGRNTPIDNPFQRWETLRKNTHPTVKPTDLMQYLVRLVTPNGWTVLDPFNWSWSTGKAVMYENKDRHKNYKYIWIELTDEYLPIAKARIEYVINKVEEKPELPYEQPLF